jgi:hypothetical protein
VAWQCQSRCVIARKGGKGREGRVGLSTNVTIMQEHPHLPVAEPAAGAESEARSEMPRASIIVSLLVALSTSLVAVWIRALDVLRSSFIMVPLLGDVLRRVGFSCLGGNRGLADCWERER